MRFQIGRPTRHFLVMTILCITALFVSRASAQQANAKIVGTVTDQQGAVVTGATVTVTNVATNVSSQTTSGKDGYYQVLDGLSAGEQVVTSGAVFISNILFAPPSD